MLNLKHGVASLVVLAGLVGAVRAQEHRENPRPELRVPEEELRRETKQRSEADDRKTEAVYLIPSTRAEGVTVVGNDAVRLGTVKDVVVRGHSGRVVYVMVTKGIEPAYAKTPDRVIPVPYAALRWNDDRKVLAVPVTEEQFRSASSFEIDQWRGLGEPAQAAGAYEYFNVSDERAAQDRKMYYVAKLGDGRDNRDGRDNPARREPRKPDDRNANETASPPPHLPPPPPSAREDRRRDPEDVVLTRADEEGSLFRVSEIRNQPLLSRDGRELGQVNDVIFDASSGRIAFLVITPAATMEVGDGRIGIPWPSFEVDQNGRLCALDLDRQTLKASPRLTQAEWGELQINGYTEDMYKRYGYAPARWSDRPAVTMSESTKMQERYRAALKSGTPRRIQGKVESIDGEATLNSPNRLVVINVKTDQGELVTVHTATQAYLDEHKIALHKGDPVTITGKAFELDGKVCMAAHEVALADGNRMVLHPEEADSK